VHSSNKSQPKPKNAWQKVWFFLWHEDSVLSWIVNILLAFLIIKFLIYPGIGLATGTKLPVVAVVSGSMEHGLPYDTWWSLHEAFYKNWDITKDTFKTYPFPNGFNKGDIIVLIGKKPQDIRVGDVIVYQSGKPYPIIHRVVEHDTLRQKYQTKGDHNLGQITDATLNEQQVQYRQLIGKAVFKIPYLGYVKIWFVELLGKAGVNVSG
jgi:signal peptidase I